jgi:hypothetical protein
MSINLSQRAFIQHAMSGDVFCAAYASEESDEIIAISESLSDAEYRDAAGVLRSPEDLELTTEDAEWANEQPWRLVEK